MEKLKLKVKEKIRDSFSAIEERHMGYENQFNQELMVGLPVIIRMDGNNFSTFTKDLKEPYDERLSELMIKTCEYAVKKTNAVCGFVGSDEITLALNAEDYIKTQIYFGGKVRKIDSVLAGKVSTYFSGMLDVYLPEKAEKLDKAIKNGEDLDYPSFDCKVWNVPNLQEGANAFYLRENSVFKNAISMACQGNNLFSDKEVHGVNGRDKQEMLFKKGINFNDYPVHFKRGVYVQRRKKVKEGFDYTPEELALLPEMHHARTNPDKVSQITEIRQIDMPIFSKIINQEGVIFGGEEPLIKT